MLEIISISTMLLYQESNDFKNWNPIYSNQEGFVYGKLIFLNT